MTTPPPRRSPPRGLRRLMLRLPIGLYRLGLGGLLGERFVLLAYAERHPTAFRALTRFMLGEPLAADTADCARLAAQVPLVALSYRAPMEEPDGR